MQQRPTAVFHFPDDDVGGLWFRSPVGIVTTSEVSQVRDALADVSAAVKGGVYAAGLLSFESSPAFDDALVINPASPFPLLWFGLFEAPGPAFDIPDIHGSEFSQWRPEITREQYEHSFERIAEGIRTGETYQVNSTFRLRSQFVGDPFDMFRKLRSAHTASYNCYVDTGEYTVLSLSPELLFDLEPIGGGLRATTKPMKGTLRRGRYRNEDLIQAQLLSSSAKDRAENVMIVDLMRNDFGKIAKTGSVAVTSLFDVAPLPTVWQMTSTVECDLPPEADFAAVLGAVFPAGSITGAPKCRSMQIIAETETSPRNIYCGTIGYAEPSRRAVFNVAIRTVLIDKQTGEAECGIGGGITADSDCSAEYEEALAKSLFLTVSRTPFDLLETLLIEDGEYFLLDRHLARLADSAAYFGFAIDVGAVGSALDTFARDTPVGKHRVRLTVGSSGSPMVTAAVVPENEPGNREVKLAERPIDSDSPFVFNKTTRRDHYHALHVNGGRFFDTLLFNNIGELTEFTTGNLVARVGAQMVTPPVSCGLLPGTFRAELIAQGLIAERVLHRDQLQDFEELWFINSVRKWVPVKIVA